MAQAAVPQRIQGFGECPPGHRFNLYLEVWNAQWEVDKNEGIKAAAARAACRMPPAAVQLLKGLHSRQAGMARALGEQRCCVIEAETTAPFATGLGLEHPIENGFAFLSPYGLPYLAGSGVKGVLRRAAEELRDDGDAALSPTH
jgi:CRISPR-associated protein Cmr6